MESKALKVPNIIISGAPSSGKGTQCEKIAAAFGLVHISTGDLLRSEVKKGSELGLAAKVHMDKGHLVPDDIFNHVVVDRLHQDDCQKKGWLLDGFPRTGPQADALTKGGIIPDVFLLLQVPDDVLVERCIGRRLDPVTGKIYHVKFFPPPEEIKARLVHRKDDNLESMSRRLAIFHKTVGVLEEKYEKYKIVINGNQSKDDVALDIAKALKNWHADQVFDVDDAMDKAIANSSSMPTRKLSDHTIAVMEAVATLEVEKSPRVS